MVCGRQADSTNWQRPPAWASQDGPWLSSHDVIFCQALYAVNTVTFYSRRRKAIIFYRSNLFCLLFFISSAWMKEQPWDLNQTWPVGQKCCWFRNSLQTFRGPCHKNVGGAKNINFLTIFLAPSALDIAYL